jgi:hypothetical protein
MPTGLDASLALIDSSFSPMMLYCSRSLQGLPELKGSAERADGQQVEKLGPAAVPAVGRWRRAGAGEGGGVSLGKQ